MDTFVGAVWNGAYLKAKDFNIKMFWEGGGGGHKSMLRD